MSKISTSNISKSLFLLRMSKHYIYAAAYVPRIHTTGFCRVIIGKGSTKSILCDINNYY